MEEVDYTQFSKEELEKSLKIHKKLAIKFEIIQLGKKLSLNSAYGVLGSEYGRFFDLRLAEGITMSGQLSIRWILRKLKTFLLPLCHKDWNGELVAAGDTDSVVYDSLIYVNGKQQKIGDYYKTLTEFAEDGVAYVDSDYSLSINKSGELETKRINYAMKHTVKKRMFKITLASGQSVTVTEDHSCIVRCKKSNKIIEMKPADLDNPFHEVISL